MRVFSNEFEKSQKLAALNTLMGLYKREWLLMVLASTPGAFPSLLDLAFSGLFHKVAVLYLDDILVFGKTFEENVHRLEQVIALLEKEGIKMESFKGKFPLS